MMKRIQIVFALLLSCGTASAHEGLNPDASYGFGVTGGFLTGSGMLVRKYFKDNYLQLGGLASTYVKGDSFNDGAYDWNVAVVAGRYFNKTYFKDAGFPVGFHAFYGMHYEYEKHTKDDYDFSPQTPTYERFYTGPGFGFDFFNPATTGFGLWFTVSYALEFDMSTNGGRLERTSFYGSTGLSYNW